MRGSSVIVTLWIVGFGALAHATEEKQEAGPSVILDKAPAGLKELIRREGRVHAFHASGADNFCFAGDTAAFAAFLGKYAKLGPIAGHRLVVRKGKGTGKAPGDKGEGKPCDWMLDVALVTLRDHHLWGEHHAEVLENPFGGTRRLEKPEHLAEMLVWTGGNIDLAKVAIPENIKVVREDRVSLILKMPPGREAVSGRPVDLTFVLRNQGEGDFAFLEDFCPLHIVHEVTLDVTGPDGAALSNVARITVGGPAFLGSGRPVVVKPRQEIELPCSRPDADKGVAWSPARTGTHKLVGRYRLPLPSCRRESPAGGVPDYIVISSEPLSLQVVPPEKK
jgi:hypothetical protein